MVVEVERSQKCPACGTPLSRDRWSAGLCPLCVFELALDDTGLEAELEPDEAPTLQFTAGTTFAEGEIQGDRYRIRSLLGRGGMGEVWRAFDLKLRQDVALKALRTELIEDKAALEILRQEVRAAREVISPNVCRVFDLQEVEAQELISMEYVDGTTLQKILRDKGPLELNEAREIATQFLAGLEAIHDAGLVHRDIKPENLMITRTGRVVVMDFGIAKGLGEGESGVVAGTPAYMSPEQARGGELEPQADLFSAGVVLAEMVEPGGIGTFEGRKRVWEGIHQAEMQISETPWSKVISKAVSVETRDRFESASALARALEEVTLRAAGDETARPYPGLSAFRQEDADYFYGRELEVEALWKKLRRPHLLAVIGPSGAGKSSFLRAGLLPTLTDGWQALIATPGHRPFANLARALAEQLPEDRSTVDSLQRFEEPEVALGLIRQWRDGHQHSLIILDQFEELFTQNPDDIQQAFAEVLGRLPLEADVFVLLSMRDDFLLYCQAFESLAPVFSEMTPLGPPTGASLRRAIVEPALKCGYRFEDESIVEEMLGEVEGQRGALPLLAFAAAQLWERRDRESGLLTRKAYEQIGGVSGALAQHAEAMLDYIGEANAPIVRELLRNLVTAQGTRASRDRDELLSVFPESEGEPFLEPSKVRPTLMPKPQRPAAKHVLNSLVDARLLTSYEIPADEENSEPHHRVEIVHESLLARWPRLVRWQRQDADSAQMRDELRSQAKLWDEHGRSEDYLWTGTVFKEYALWRESYPGRLTDVEEAFGAAMVHLDERQKRRRRIVVATVIAALVVGLSIVTGFWWQAEEERRRAEAETRRAEAGRLVALGEVEITTFPSESLAWAIKSLEITDTLEGRLLALRALQKGPLTALTERNGVIPAAGIFSPNGEFLASIAEDQIGLHFADGRQPVLLHQYSPLRGSYPMLAFQSDEVLLADFDGEFRWFSIPDGKEIRRVEEGRGAIDWALSDGYLSVTDGDVEGMVTLEWWPYDDGSYRTIGSMPDFRAWDIDPAGDWMVYSSGTDVFHRSLRNWSRPPRPIGDHAAKVRAVALHSGSEFIAIADDSLDVSLWSTDGLFVRNLRSPPKGGALTLGFDPSGRWLAAAGGGTGTQTVLLWDIEAPAYAEPIVLNRKDGGGGIGLPVFHPSKPWVLMRRPSSISFWPLPRRSPWVILENTIGANIGGLVFTPDDRWLVAMGGGAGVTAWPLEAQNNGAVKTLLERSPKFMSQFAIQLSGNQVALGVSEGQIVIASLEGAPPQELPGRVLGTGARLAFSPGGRYLAGVPWAGNPEEMVLQLWDLESGAARSLGKESEIEVTSFIGFDDDRHVRWSGYVDTATAADSERGETRVYDLEDGSFEIVGGGRPESIRAVSTAENAMILAEGSVWSEMELFRMDLETGEKHRIVTHGDPAHLRGLVLDPSGRWMATGGREDTIVRVGPVTGEEPHLLFDAQGDVLGLAISNDGRWLASAGVGSALCVWPMPDMTQPPLHTMPLDELLARLRSATNLRVVEDPESTTGWKVEIGPFPGWAEVPEW